MSVLSELMIKIGVDTGDVSKGLSSVEKDIKGFQNAVNSALGIFGVSLSIAGIAELTKNTIAWGVELGNTARQLGITADEVARFQYAAQESNVPVEALQSNFSVLTRRMFEASQGNAQARQVFRDFGIAFQNADGSLRNFSDVLPEIANRISNTKDKTFALAEAQLLLGRSARDTFGLLDKGADNLKSLGDEFDKISGGADKINNFAAKTQEFDKAWQKLSLTMKIFMVDVIGPLLPAMTSLVDMLTKGVDLLQRFSPLAGFARFLGTLDGGGSLGDAWKSAVTPTVGGVPQTTLPETVVTAPSLAGGGIQDKRGGFNLEEVQAQIKEFNKSFLDMNKSMTNVWSATMESFVGGFSKGITGMIFEGKKFGDAVKEWALDMAKAFVAAVSEMIAKWLAFMALKSVGRMFGLPFLDQGGYIPSARNGLLYAADGVAMTGHMGESGIPAVVHPNEVITPIDKLFDMIKSVSGGKTEINVYSQNSDPRQVAELVAAEIERKKRAP